MSSFVNRELTQKTTKTVSKMSFHFQNKSHIIRIGSNCSKSFQIESV